MLSLPHGRALLTIGWLMVVAIIAGSLIPMGVRAGMPHGDKVLHFLGYFGLTIWFAGLYPLRRLWIIAVAFAFMGGMLEILQAALTSHRQMDALDLAVNTLGIGSACALAMMGLSHWAIRLEAWFMRRAVRQE